MWLTVPQAATLLGCSASFIRSLCNRKEVVSTRVGHKGRGGVGALRIRSDSIDAYLAARETGQIAKVDVLSIGLSFAKKEERQMPASYGISLLRSVGQSQFMENSAKPFASKILASGSPAGRRCTMTVSVPNVSKQ